MALAKLVLILIFLMPLAYAECPDGCQCLTEAAAEKQFAEPYKCSDESCGFELGGTLTAQIQIPKYCYREKPDCDNVEITLTQKPIDPGPDDEVRFIAEADKEECILEIKLIVNDEKVKECDSGYCRYTGGPYLGTLTFEVDVEDIYGNEVLPMQSAIESLIEKMPEALKLCPPVSGTIRFVQDGNIHVFPYPGETLKVRAGKIEREMTVLRPVQDTTPSVGGTPVRLPGGGKFTAPSGATYTLPEGMATNIIEYDNTMTSVLQGMNWVEDTLIIFNETREVSVIPIIAPGSGEFPTDQVMGFNYSIFICEPGEWIIQPIYVPYGDTCAWRGNWTPPSYRINASELTAMVGYQGADFNYSQIDSTPPTATANYYPSPPTITDTITVIITATDDSGIQRIRVNEKELVDFETDMWNVSDTFIRQCDWTDTCTYSKFTFSSADVKYLYNTFELCDTYGNVGSSWDFVNIIDKCYDGIQNQGEQNIDCGGPCTPCDVCSATTLPTRFDWRSWKGQNWLTSVKDQANCGSCWAFSAVGAIEAEYNVQQDSLINIDLSEQNCVSDCGCDGSCAGGYTEDAFEFVRDTGINDESCFSYTSGSCCGACDTCVGCSCLTFCEDGTTCSQPTDCSTRCSNWQNELWSINSFQGIYGPDLKRQLVCQGPLSVTSSTWQHGLVLVGWDDYSDICNDNYGTNGCWILKNSWGVFTGKWNSDVFHQDGYAYIPYYPGHTYSDIEIWPTYYAEGISQ